MTTTDTTSELLGRVEILSAEDVLLGAGNWRYTAKRDEAELIPLTITTGGRAAYMRFYAPNGSFMGDCSVGTLRSDADARVDHVDLQEGGTFSLRRMTFIHITACPHCGKSLTRART